MPVKISDIDTAPLSLDPAKKRLLRNIFGKIPVLHLVIAVSVYLVVLFFYVFYQKFIAPSVMFNGLKEVMCGYQKKFLRMHYSMRTDYPN